MNGAFESMALALMACLAERASAVGTQGQRLSASYYARTRGNFVYAKHARPRLPTVCD